MVVGAFLGGFHLLWAVLVATGFAQVLMDWIYWLHFLNNPFVLDVFDPARAALLVGFTAVVGYVGGWLFTTLWNSMLKKRR